MNSIFLATLAFVCPVAGAAIGMAVRRRLPKHHLSKDSTDVIKLSTGVIATLVALVLSLLISSANSFRSQVQSEYLQNITSVGQLDQRLRAYGPETAEARRLLHSIVAAAARQRWPREDFGAAPLLGGSMAAALLDLERQILQLRPANDEQRWFQGQALQVVGSLVQIQRLIANQSGASSFPLPVLVFVIFCGVAILGSFGLFVEPNPTVVAALALAALAEAGAIFLIVELNTPFNGLLQLPSAPLKALLATLSA